MYKKQAASQINKRQIALHRQTIRNLTLHDLALPKGGIEESSWALSVCHSERPCHLPP